MPQPARNTLAIVGAGPVGLEAACAALDRGFDVHVFERGEVGAHPSAWGHVRMFSTWRDVVGPRTAARLAASGWAAPPADDRPTGAELAERVLQPLARLPELKDRVHTSAQVVSIGRTGALRHDAERDDARDQRPFRLLVRDAGGRENLLHAFAVIDASGTYGAPLRAGDGGVPARGESYLAPQLVYHPDDVAGLRRARHAGRRTLVIGGGASAATTVDALVALAADVPGTTVLWVTRGDATRFAGEAADDPLAPRAALFMRARAHTTAADGPVTWIGGAMLEGLEYNSATHRYRAALRVGDAIRQEEVDEVVVNAGFQADGALHGELRVRTCTRTGAVRALSSAWRGELPADAPERLRTGEPGFFVLGAKSFGRAGGFLLPIGWRQVDDAIATLAAARGL